MGALVEILRKPAPGSYPTPASAHNPNPAVPGSIPPGGRDRAELHTNPGRDRHDARGRSLCRLWRVLAGGFVWRDRGCAAGFPAGEPALAGAHAAATVRRARHLRRPADVAGTRGRSGAATRRGGGGRRTHSCAVNDPFAATARLELVEDERGRLCRRAEWLANERRVVAECLYHAIVATGVRSGDGPDGTPRAGGAALSATDAKAVMELFAEVATPTVARACADARARSLDAGRAQAAAAQALRGRWRIRRVLRGPGRREPSDDCGSSRGGTGGPPGGARDRPRRRRRRHPERRFERWFNKRKRRQIVRAGRRGCVRSAAEGCGRRERASAGGSAPVKIDPLRALGDYPFLNQSQRDQRDRFGFDGQQQPWQQQQQQQAGAAADLRSRSRARRLTGRRLRSAAVLAAARATWAMFGVRTGNTGKTTPIFSAAATHRE